ncbi:MAG TPA: 30S ribosomal protein S20, partial [candidate division WOR-3 bacterium]|nr:30S ribosomal protein S20 [candidate division WOR-3 bacterium]
MANTRSAEKRARQNIKRRQRNRGMKTRIKNLTKKVLSEKD